MHLCLFQLQLYMWWIKNVYVKDFTDFSIEKMRDDSRASHERSE